MPLSFEEELLYQIALSQIPGVGNQTAKKLLAYFGSMEDLFNKKYHQLLKVNDIGPVLAKAISQKIYFKKAEEIFQKVQKNNLKTFFFLSNDYPEKLRNCSDSPILLFAKGDQLNFNKPSIAVVGTRKSTHYGESLTRELVQFAQPFEINFISGFAYGIDIAMHKACIDFGVCNYAIMAGGLDYIYPFAHKKYVNDLLTIGGIISEHAWGFKPDPRYFPMRNRIIAGLSDVVVVMEAASKGGALITADIANSYNREVFAAPGDLDKYYSKGCNRLIFENKAALYLSPENFFEWMNWLDKPKTTPKESILINFDGLHPKEIRLVELLKNKNEENFENLAGLAEMKISQIFSLAIQLELKGFLKILPGNKCKLI